MRLGSLVSSLFSLLVLVLASCGGGAALVDTPDGNAPVADATAPSPTDSATGTPGDASLAGGDDLATTPVPDAAEPDYPWSWAPQPPANIAQNAPGCSSLDWLAKFLAYRTRFRGDGTADNPGFIGIGDGPGMSMPATVRDRLADCANDWQLTSCRNQPIPNANGALRWGDGTVWMGWYLRTLAAEYAALSVLHVDTAQTEQDIAYALDALDRLDEVAETWFAGAQPARDGFFLRDDVTQSLIWSDPNHTVLRFPRNDAFAGFACVGSGGNCGTVTTVDGYFISQDQFIEMLPGLAMVARLLPDTLMINGQSLTWRAKEFTHRVTMYLKNNDWKIVDPTGNSPPNQWGGSAAPYSTQIAKAANFITGNAFGVADYGVPGGLLEAAALAEGATVWAAVDVGFAAETLNNQAMILSLASVTDDWSDAKLAARDSDWDAPVYAMISALLHGRPLPPGVSRSHVEAMLTSAPCGGPCHGVPGCEEAPGWKGEHRFKSPEDRNGDTYGVNGEYGGLDYILLWGLYVQLSMGNTQLVWQSPPRCVGPTTLDDLLAGGAAGATEYDPWSDCNRRDFGRAFCGRPFVHWLDAAYQGNAHIFFSGGELVCTGKAPCRVVTGAVSGTPGEDLFLGSPADDSFNAGDGDDCLYGFGGSDTLHGDRGSDEIHGGPGGDTLCGEGCLAAEVDGEPDNIFGDEDDDHIEGGPATDVLIGGMGNDTIRGGLGYDRIDGEDGDDDLDGEMGDDLIEGGPGNDRIIGGFGSDTLRGGDGRDKLDGGEGDDTLFGGTGDDFLMGGAGQDTLWAEDGSDRLCGGCGADNLYGGWGPGTDECRGEAATICATNTSNNVQECEVSLEGNIFSGNPLKCLDSAFDGW